MVPPRRSVADWLLLAIAVEKTVQHTFITWAFAANRFDLRTQVLPPWEVLMVSGGVVAVLFAVAAVGLWRWRAWAPTLLVALALFDIGGEFVAQGTVIIEIVVSFIVAVILLPLAWRARPRYEGYGR
ncbi:MAG: hypothetical protein CVU47_06240 [Chloroflexi bacterium HGW-Chloroflexi-9]|nr:MAG: hypothetical protein CVU47_06240 [Chloroflexi bacterium HGW-Chloroflexi-9]